MGREDVKRALQAMDDDETRQRLRAGDYEAVSELNLTDDERYLVREAAGDYPDVAGFAFMHMAAGTQDAMKRVLFGAAGVTGGREQTGPFLSAVQYGMGWDLKESN
jgi:hypothetical protein